jgi:hypothetical protein
MTVTLRASETRIFLEDASLVYTQYMFKTQERPNSIVEKSGLWCFSFLSDSDTSESEGGWLGTHSVWQTNWFRSEVYSGSMSSLTALFAHLPQYRTGSDLYILSNLYNPVFETRELRDQSGIMGLGTPVPTTVWTCEHSTHPKKDLAFINLFEKVLICTVPLWY